MLVAQFAHAAEVIISVFDLINGMGAPKADMPQDMFKAGQHRPTCLCGRGVASDWSPLGTPPLHLDRR